MRFSSGVRHRELLSIAMILCNFIDSLEMPGRNEKRSFPLLIRWFSDNWSQIGPLLSAIDLRDERDSLINFDREYQENRKSC
jgi:hypothetical protein